MGRGLRLCSGVRLLSSAAGRLFLIERLLAESVQYPAGLRVGHGDPGLEAEAGPEGFGLCVAGDVPEGYILCAFAGEPL